MLYSKDNHTIEYSQGKYRWDNWAAPKKNGAIDHSNAMTGDDLKEFVNQMTYSLILKSFGQRADSPNTIEYKIGEIFSELNNKCNVVTLCVQF